MVLVASRRQIDSEELGRGYVNNWSTQDLVDYVRNKKVKNIYLERDHGGPWQGNFETSKNLDVNESLQAAKKSYEADIDAGLQILHIDPTIPIKNEYLSQSTIQSRLFELYGHLSEYARKTDKKILFEIGSEEQNGSYTDLEQLEDFLSTTSQFCKKNNFDHPLFVVIQTGAKVIENKNIGLFERGTSFDKKYLIKNIKDASAVANKYKINVKEHNADYLSFENLCLRPSIGIRAANIAPEFGYLETKAIMFLLNNFGQKTDYEHFIDVVVDSKKWAKWVSPELNLKNSEKACLAGHYCYSDPKIIEIKKRLKFDLDQRDINLDETLKKVIRATLYKYAMAFGLH